MVAVLMALLISSISWAAPQATKVKTKLAEESSIPIGGEALGTTQADESVSITSNITETIQSFHFEEGDLVNKGDLLIVFTKDEEEAQHDAIQAELDEFIREVKRLKRLVKKGAAPQSQLDTKITDQLMTEARLREIKAKIADRTIRAPFTGVVGFRNHSVGALVQPGTTITTLDSIQDMKVDMTVPATFLPILRRGMPFTATSDVFPERDFKGTITHLDTRVDERTRSLKVRGLIPNEDLSLKPGLFMNVVITTQTRKGILVPEIAVIFKEDKQYLYMVDENMTIFQREVTLGTRVRGDVEVKSGLKLGEEFVVEGTVKVGPGKKVEVITSDPS